MYNRANPLLILIILLGKRVSFLHSKANPLLSPCTPGGRRANLLYSKVNPLSALTIHLDRLANLRVNQPSSRLSHLFRKDNLAPSKFVLLGRQVRLKPNQVNLPAR